MTVGALETQREKPRCIQHRAQWPAAAHRAVTNRVRRDGKFFRLGAEKFYVKGVTYGPFAPNESGEPLPRRRIRGGL